MAQKPFFVQPLALGAIATGNEKTNRPATHLGEAYAGMLWESTGNSNLWVRGDLGSAQDIDFIGLLGTNALPGTTIRVRLGDTQGEVDGTADYDSGAVTLINPTPAFVPPKGYHAHIEAGAVYTKRWWRIDIGSHTGDFSASVLVLGKKIQPATYYEPQWQPGVRDLGAISFGRNGVPGVSSGTLEDTLAAKLAWLTEAEMETKFLPFAKSIGRTNPYFLCFDPEATSYRQARTHYGYNEDHWQFTKLGYDRWQAEISLLAVL